MQEDLIFLIHVINQSITKFCIVLIYETVYTTEVFASYRLSTLFFMTLYEPENPASLDTHRLVIIDAFQIYFLAELFFDFSLRASKISFTVFPTEIPREKPFYFGKYGRNIGI